MRSQPIKKLSTKKKPKKSGKGFKLATGKASSAFPMQARQGFSGSTGAAQGYKK